MPSGRRLLGLLSEGSFFVKREVLYRHMCYIVIFCPYVKNRVHHIGICDKIIVITTEEG